jgi:hypothetical protein
MSRGFVKNMYFYVKKAVAKRFVLQQLFVVFI